MGKQGNQAQFHVIAQPDAEPVRAYRWIERMRRIEGLPELVKSGSYRPGELVGAKSGLHALCSAHKQRVSETSPQSRDGITEGWLTQPYPSRGSTDMPLIDQRFKGEQEVKIDSANIHGVNIAYYDYLFRK
jgi:hypothetical protein